MAAQERGKLSEIGKDVRNVGIVGGILGIVAALVEAPIAAPLILGGGALAVSGEIFSQATQKKS